MSRHTDCSQNGEVISAFVEVNFAFGRVNAAGHVNDVIAFAHVDARPHSGRSQRVAVGTIGRDHAKLGLVDEGQRARAALGCAQRAH